MIILYSWFLRIPEYYILGKFGLYFPMHLYNNYAGILNFILQLVDLRLPSFSRFHRV